MIEVTRLGGGELMINVDLILSIEQTPDTMIVFTNGEKLLVRETPAAVVERIVEYRRRLLAASVVSERADVSHGA